MQSTGYIRYEDLPLEASDGRHLNVEFVSNVYWVDQQRVIQCNIRDITARKQAEAEIQQLNQDLERRVAERTRELAAANARLTELDQLKSKFVSDVSHELRTPIANLKLFIDLLERGKPEKQAQYLAVLHAQARRVVALVDDILDLSRLEQRKEQGVGLSSGSAQRAGRSGGAGASASCRSRWTGAHF